MYTTLFVIDTRYCWCLIKLALPFTFQQKRILGPDEPTGTQVPSMFLNFIGSDIDWGYNTEPEKQACLAEMDQKCYWPRGKV